MAGPWFGLFVFVQQHWAKKYTPAHQNPYHKKVTSTHGEKKENQTG